MRKKIGLVLMLLGTGLPTAVFPLTLGHFSPEFGLNLLGGIEWVISDAVSIPFRYILSGGLALFFLGLGVWGWR